MTFEAFGLSDIGTSRKTNEDVWVSLSDLGFFAIADGMGGHKAGDIAANIAISSVVESIKKIQTKDPLELILELRYALEEANKKILSVSMKKPECFGMGTTFCCILLKEDFVIHAHIGDSRVYLLREKRLKLLTEDHSLLAKLEKSGIKSQTPYPYKNVITKALGTGPKPEPEIAFCPTKQNDSFILCSDGLSDVLTIEEIEKTLLDTPSIESASFLLIERAKNKGSCDNITVVIAQKEKADAKNLSRQQRDDPLGSKGISSDATGA